MSDGGNTVPRIVKSEHIGPDDTGDNISARKVAGYVWNPDTSEWERQTTTTTYTTRIDEASATVTYIGDAAIGSATSAAVWRVKKIDTTSGTSITFADGDGTFTKIWDDRATITYS